MSTADVLAYESVHTSQFSTPHSRNISAYSQEDDFEAVVSAVEQYIGHDISDAHARTIPVDQFLRGLGAEPGEVEGGDARLTDIAKSQEVVDLRDKYCAEMRMEVQRYGPFCNLANHIIQQFEGTNILFVRNDPKLIDGVCKSKRKPDIIGIRDGHVSVVGGLWKNYNDRGPPVITGSSQRDKSSRKGKGKAGDKKKVAKHFVPWGWKDIQYVAEFKKRRYVIDLHRSAVARTKRKSGSGKASGHAGSSETKGRTSSPHMMQSESSSKIPSSESAKRKFMEELQEEEEGRGYLKRQRQSANDVRYDLQLGGAKYAVDQLSALTHRRHVIEFLVIDGVLVLAYYDRGGPVYSEDLSFVEDLYRFSLLIKLLATRDPWQRGFLERLVDVTSLSIGDGSSPASTTEERKGQDRDANALRTGSSTLVSPSGGLEQSGQICMNEAFEDESEPVPPPTPPIDSQQPAEVTVPVGDEEGSAAIVVPTSKPPDPAIEPKLGKHRYDLKLSHHTVRLHDLCGKRPPYGLISRGSSVFRSKCETLDGPPSGVCAAKISWPLARRRSEATILREARDILRWMDVNPAQKEKYGYGKRKLEDCLPIVYWAEDIDDLQKENSFRWRMTTLGNVSKSANRVCRAIVMEHLVPLRYVRNVDHFKQAIRDVVLAHHLLFTSESQILHRDISVDNLMVRYNKDGTVCGVLTDFDLAAMFREATEDHTGTRTGTRPFMASELLVSDPPPIHLERFDWESFFYVICWIGCRYSEGKEVNKSILLDWHTPKDANLATIKERWLFGPGVIRNFTPFYRSIAVDWVTHLQSLVSDGEKEKERVMTAGWMAIPGDPIHKEFDEDTLGGHVTWDRFWEILQN